eukprot:298483_1
MAVQAVSFSNTSISVRALSVWFFWFGEMRADHQKTRVAADHRRVHVMAIVFGEWADALPLLLKENTNLHYPRERWALTKLMHYTKKSILFKRIGMLHRRFIQRRSFRMWTTFCVTEKGRRPLLESVATVFSRHWYHEYRG